MAPLAGSTSRRCAHNTRRTHRSLNGEKLTGLTHDERVAGKSEGGTVRVRDHGALRRDGLFHRRSGESVSESEEQDGADRVVEFHRKNEQFTKFFPAFRCG